jgi:Double zinc ribbon
VADVVTCPSCGSENETGRKFCGECGNALAQACPSCGAANPPTVKFCGECGTALTASVRPIAAEPPTAAPTAERRLVCVVFADLVGFTTLSESRDAEEADEILRRVEERPPGLRAPFLDAQAQRFRARMNSDEKAFKAAAAAFGECGLRFWLAVTLLEHGELTGDDALLDEAREIFEELKAPPWLERLDALAARGTEVPA